MDEARMRAAQEGHKRYTGKPCRVCGNDVRYVATGTCVKCAARHSATYREKIRETLKAARDE